ncbi:MAG: ferredoxin [Desulfobacterales bacterium]|nr:ferredoxin [Desulfobacterales bacterium]
MADKTRKFEDNAPGRYYVSEECIGCTLCSEIAPDNFTLNTDENLETEYNYVCKQPLTEQEEQLCEEAMASCPGSAIGNDGEVRSEK